MANLRILSTGAKIACGERLIHEERGVFQEITQITGLFPDVKAAQERLISFQVQTGGDEAWKRASALLALLDPRQDHCMRAAWYAVEAAVCAERSLEAPDEAAIEAALALRAKLVPEGLSMTLRTYLEEVGNCRKAVASLSAADWDLAATLPAGKSDVAQIIRRWVAVTEAMSDQLAIQSAAAGAAPADQDSLHQAELEWGRKVNLVLTVLEESDAPAELKHRLTGLIDEAIAKAERAAEAQKKAEAAGEPLPAGPSPEDA